MVSNDQIRLDFVCVHNAGRSQIAAAFAERERSERDLEDVIEIHSGGTEPGDTVHEEVVRAMGEVGIDISGRSPKWIADLDDLKETDYLITMGCFISEFDPAQYGVESYEWDLTNPEGQDLETVREIRDEIGRRVKTLFDEIEQVTEERANTDSSGSVVTAIQDFLLP
ncbi:low molecular weight phosphatase family protein [Natronoarchaeum sp. GCM10025703]|uniref:arsenate-mycothiol transferase ArsC n=1 Tax=unclassified Natronoarchaeum TaxID=2620183 RepID=UPI00361DF213